ncbi:MAG: ribonuclease E inhibitor RraB [Chloroflexota bacterium]
MIEIPTRLGLAYAQYTHWNKLMGALIRVLPGLYESRLSDFGAIVRQREVLMTFFPLEAAVREKMVELVGHEDVPKHARKFPLFRAQGGIEPRTGRVLSWWLWDGDREWKLEKLEPEHHRLPLREVVMPPLLVSRLEEGLPQELGAVAQADSAQATGASRQRDEWIAQGQRSGGPTRHFLYLSREDWAKKAAKTLVGLGYSVDVRPSVGGDWLLLVSSPDGKDPETERADLEKLSTRLNAEYDGWETAVDG